MKITMTMQEFHDAMKCAAYSGARAILDNKRAPAVQSELNNRRPDSQELSPDVHLLICDAGRATAAKMMGCKMPGGDEA